MGVHFIAFMLVWNQRSIGLLGALLTLLGVGGFVLAATPALAWVPVVSGVLSGVTLLTLSLAVVTRELGQRPETDGKVDGKSRDH